MAGLASQLPPLAPYPPASIRQSLSAGDWQACLDAWILNLTYRLRLNDRDFKSTAPDAGDFCSSFFQNCRHGGSDNSSAEQKLRRLSFDFSRRLLKAVGADQALYSSMSIALFPFLADFCAAFHGTAGLKLALQEAWPGLSSNITSAAESEKIRQMKLMTTTRGSIPEDALVSLQRTSRIVQELPNLGTVFMSGDDYLDALSLTYNQSPEQGLEAIQKAATENLHVCLWSLTQAQPVMTSLLLDQLFNLKTISSENPSKGKPDNQALSQPSILSSLICSTSFLQRLKAFFADPKVPHHARAQSMIASLSTYHQQMAHLHPPPRRRIRKTRKGKGVGHGHTDASHEMHIHAMTQVSTLQELFPDLTPAYLLRLLDHFNNDVENVTAALLEPESLPPYLADQDAEADPPSMPQPSSTVPDRKNKFDNDNFAGLRISDKQLHYGKAESRTSIDEPSSERNKHKAAILSALAAFDSDDDERDDTYDVADVGGTVDTALPGTDDAEAVPAKKQQANVEGLEAAKADEILYGAWKADANAFLRDSKTRLGQVRSQLKRELSEATGQTWTDEMIEGWAVMVSRDAQRQRSLENSFGAATGFSGQQTQIERTSWRHVADGEGTDEDEERADGSTRGGPRGRGGRGGRARGRGNTAGPASEASTQAARRRKEQRSGGNHGRREGRAKKVVRGFGGQPAI